MSDTLIFFNENCSKCKVALDKLKETEAKPAVIKYLDDPLSRTKLRIVTAMLESPVEDMVRKDSRFKELGLNADDYMDRESVIDLLLEHPELMQRPIVLRGGKAIIARTDEAIEQMLRL